MGFRPAWPGLHSEASFQTLLRSPTPMHADTPRRGIPLHTRILLGLFLDAAAGVAANIFYHDHPTLLWVVDNVAYPVGQVFLRLLFMIVVPLIFCSISLGVASLGDLGKVGRIGGKTLGFFLATT